MKQTQLSILLTILFLFVISCAEKDDEAAIRALIKKGAELAEDHDVSGILELTTEDVVALPGRHNRLEIKRIIWSAFMHYGKLRVLYPKPSVDLSDTENGASCRIYLLIVKKEQTLPALKELYNDPKRWLEEVGENADLYQINLQLLKKDGTWLVQKAHLEGFKGVGFSDAAGHHSCIIINILLIFEVRRLYESTFCRGECSRARKTALSCHTVNRRRTEPPSGKRLDDRSCPCASGILGSAITIFDAQMEKERG
jgi:hypothetical protein